MVSKDHNLSIRRQCRLLSLAQSNLYYQPKGENSENLRFMAIIDQQFLDTPWYGSRQMARYMQRQGHKCGRHWVRRLMRIMRSPLGDCSTITRRAAGANLSNTEHQQEAPAAQIYPYLLRGLTIDRPNQVWCVDITYIPMRRGFLYLVAVMDWYSRKVLSWRLSNSMEADFCVEALKEAIAKYGKPEIMNSDQGSQFTGFEWIQTLKDADIKISPLTHVNMRCRAVHGRTRALAPLSSLQAATAGQRITE